MKKTLAILALLLPAFLGLKAQKSEVYAPGGKAINGYDAVAFFKQSQPVKGVDSLSYSYDGVTWLFSTRENLNAFKANPNHFVPQYGGYCAYGTADGDGHKAPTKPETWTIVNDKLYFNYNLDVKKSWSKDRETLIQKADKNWPELKDKP